MPAKVPRPRVAVMLKPETYQALKAMAKAGGVSMSAFVAGVLDEMTPQLRQMAEAMQMVKRDRIEALDSMGAMLADLLHEGTAASVEIHQKRQALRRMTQDRNPTGPRKPRAKVKAKAAGKRKPS